MPELPVPPRSEWPEHAKAADFEWQPFTAGFDYLKEFYDVLLPDGTVIKHCWPNAGKMNGRKTYTPADNIQVRLSRDHPCDEPAVDDVGQSAVFNAKEQVAEAMDKYLDDKQAGPSVKMLLGATMAQAMAMIPRGRTVRSYGTSYRDAVARSKTHAEVAKIVDRAVKANVPPAALRKLEKAAARRHRELNKQGAR